MFTCDAYAALVSSAPIWYDENGATAYIYKWHSLFPHRMVPAYTLLVYQRMFPGRVTSRVGDTPRPPASLDLSACNCFSCDGDTYNRESSFTNTVD